MEKLEIVIRIYKNRGKNFSNCQQILEHNYENFKILPVIGDTLSDNNNNDYQILKRSFDIGVVALYVLDDK